MGYLWLACDESSDGPLIPIDLSFAHFVSQVGDQALHGCFTIMLTSVQVIKILINGRMISSKILFRNIS